MLTPPRLEVASLGQDIAKLGSMTAGDKHVLLALDARTLRMHSGAEESQLSFDFVAGHSKGQEQLFRGKHLSVQFPECSIWCDRSPKPCDSQHGAVI